MFYKDSWKSYIILGQHVCEVICMYKDIEKLAYYSNCWVYQGFNKYDTINYLIEKKLLKVDEEGVLRPTTVGIRY